MEKFKKQLTLVPKGESNVNIIKDTVYSSYHNCPRTRTFARWINTGIKPVNREIIVARTNKTKLRVRLWNSLISKDSA